MKEFHAAIAEISTRLKIQKCHRVGQIFLHANHNLIFKCTSSRVWVEILDVMSL